MLKRNRALSIVVAALMCLALLAPAFVAPAPASASSTYTAMTCPVVEPNSSTPVNLGAVEVSVPEASALANYSVVTVSLPTELSIPWDTLYSSGSTIVRGINSTHIVNSHSAVGSTGVWIVVPTNYPGTSNPNGISTTNIFTKSYGTTSGIPQVSNAFDIKITGAAGGPAKFYIYFNGVTVGSVDTEVKITFMPSANSGFTFGQVTVAKASSAGATLTICKSVKNITAGGTNAIDVISIMEQQKGTLKPGEVVKIKLPNGFTWRSKPTVSLGWGFQGLVAGDVIPSTDVSISDDSGRSLKITLPAAISGATDAGKLVIPTAYINVDETVAKVGDVVAHISSDLGNVTETDITVATYVDYSVTLTEGEAKNVVAGKIDQEVGNFTLKEGAPGSLVVNRTIVLQLPDGVKWDDRQSTFAWGNNVEKIKGDAGSDALTFQVNPNDASILKITVAKATSNEAAEYKIKKLKVTVAPNFSGDIVATVSGSQGITGKVKLAAAKVPVTLQSDGSAKVIIGQQAQATSDILIKETVKEGILVENFTAVSAKDSLPALAAKNIKKIYLVLPSGVKFYERPSVSVTEGDAVIDSYDAYEDTLTITMKANSIKPSTIKVSNIKVTLDRTVPEGDLTAKLARGTDALAENWDDFTTVKEMTSVKIANCVTPAPAEQGRNASFFIGSTVMTVNGSNIIMDAAPYIKNGRTYVPVRYLGDALGATTSWDAATQTVTVTKGNKTVVLVIGSKIAKVNGQDVVMDVAPEISNGRTMLPARYVAEGLGYQVGWNPALKQVVIQ